MATKKEVQTAKLVDEYLERMLSGKAVTAKEFLDRCPPRVREDVRLALEGADFLASSYEPLLVRSGGAQAVGRRINEAMERKRLLREMEERAAAHAIPDRPLSASGVLEWLSEIVGVSGLGGAGQPVEETVPLLLYRNREAGARLEQASRDRLQATLLMSRAERVAQRLLGEAGIADAPVSPYEIARTHGVLVIEQRAEGCDGCVLIEGYSAAILVNATIEPEERRRFTVAHELGHVALHRDGLRFRREQLDEIEGETAPGMEAEANAFAAELLMPASLVDREFARQIPSFNVVEAMVGRFRVSFTAAALRLVKRSHYSCALALTKGGKIAWLARSSEWRRYYVPTGVPPHSGTATATLLRGEELTHRRYPTLASYWSPEHRAGDDAELVEEVRHGYGESVLTLLYDQDA